MVAGIERYFQIARCFRDEDLRADRQPEFTQIDVEASFVDQEALIALIEQLLARTFNEACGANVTAPFPRMTHQEAMDRYGSDKPDTRYGSEIVDLGETFAGSEFKLFKSVLANGGVVRAINAKGFACITTGQIKRLEELAKEAGAAVLRISRLKTASGSHRS